MGATVGPRVGSNVIGSLGSFVGKRVTCGSLSVGLEGLPQSKSSHIVGDIVVGSVGILVVGILVGPLGGGLGAGFFVP